MCPEQTIHSFPFNSDRQYLLTWLSAYWQKNNNNTQVQVYKYAMSDSREISIPTPRRVNGEIPKGMGDSKGHIFTAEYNNNMNFQRDWGGCLN